MRTIVLAKVREGQKQAEYAQKASEKIAGIVQNNQLPKIVDLMHQMYPILAEDRIAATINVLKVTQNIQELENAVSGGSTQYERLQRYGCQWELPCWIAKAIICDLKKGIDIDNPSRQDLRESEVLRVAETFQCPKETIDAFIDSLSGIPEKRDEKSFSVPSEEDAVKRLHPLARKAWEKKHSGLLDCEILSETLKVYPDKKSWSADNWLQRTEKVPELLFYNSHERLDLEEVLLSLLN